MLENEKKRNRKRVLDRIFLRMKRFKYEIIYPILVDEIGISPLYPTKRGLF